MTERPERTTTCAFAIGERRLTVEDVIAAAYFRGELDECWERLLAAAECERRAVELGEPDEEPLQAAVEQFRYERDLITADETEAWLEARGLSEQDFSAYFTRRYWAAQLDGQAEAAAVDYLSAPEEWRDVLRVELLMSGDFDGLALTLANACAAAVKSPGKITPKAIETARTEFFERSGLEAASVPAWLAKMPRDEAWLEEMLALEAAARAQSVEVLTPAQRERMLNALRMELTRVELETVEMESIDAANETILCVREDGMAMAEVAAEGRYPYWQEECMIEEMDPELQQKLLCAAPGELLEPIAHGDGFQLYRVNRKTEPDLEDARICARVDEEILKRHFSELVAGRVRWEPGFLPP